MFVCVSWLLVKAYEVFLALVAFFALQDECAFEWQVVERKCVQQKDESQENTHNQAAVFASNINVTEGFWALTFWRRGPVRQVGKAVKVATQKLGGKGERLDQFHKKQGCAVVFFREPIEELDNGYELNATVKCVGEHFLSLNHIDHLLLSGYWGF